MGELNRPEAFEIVQDLKKGTPPPARLVHHLHVGRHKWLDGMAWYLDTAKDAALSAVRFIVGDPGSGKTHFLRMTAHMALERNFVVCEVALSPDVRLDRFDTVWRVMMSNLATNYSGGKPEGIEDVLNRWCQKAAQSPERSLAELDNIPNLDPDFRKAMRGYLQAWFSETDWDAYLQWLKGDSIRPPGVRIRIDRTSARTMLRSFVVFLKHLGYSGMVLFLDELELIPEQPNYRIRESAYDILRQFIDNTDNVHSFLLLCSMTHRMITDQQRGIPSYPALWQRVGGMFETTTRDYRTITVNLNQIPLSAEELFDLAKRIRAVHSIAFNWEAEKFISESVLQQLAQDAAGRTTEVPPPRYLVELTVKLLEEQQQNLDRSVADLLPDFRDQTLTSIRQAEQSRYRPWTQ